MPTGEEIQKNESIVGKLSTFYDKKPVIRSLLQLIPWWGSADSLLTHRANEIRIERLRTFFDELSAGKHEISEELIQQEDFLHCYFCTLRAVTNTRHREKIKLFARLFESSISPEKASTTDEFEEVLAILDAVSLREFAVLCELHRLEALNARKDGDNELQHASNYWNTFKELAASKHSITENYFTAFMARLERTGLYLRITGSFTSYNGNVGNTTPLFARVLELVALESTQAEAQKQSTTET